MNETNCENKLVIELDASTESSVLSEDCDGSSGELESSECDGSSECGGSSEFGGCSLESGGCSLGCSFGCSLGCDPAFVEIVPEKLKKKILVEAEADAPSPKQQQEVYVHYTGTLPNGSVFDSSVERGKPFNFVLGKNTVIQGWEKE